MRWLDNRRLRRVRRELHAAGVPDWVPVSIPVPSARYYIWATLDSVAGQLFVRADEWLTKWPEPLPLLMHECDEALAGHDSEPQPTPRDLDAPTALVVLHSDGTSAGIGHGPLNRPPQELRYSLRDLLYLAKIDIGTRLS